MSSEIAKLLHEVRASACTYVVLSDPEADVLALWVAHTYVFEYGETTPYIAILSPTMGSGKTRLLEILEHLVSRPWTAVDVTGPTLFRTIAAESPTILIDEADALSVSPIRAVLNAGFRRGGSVPRVESVKGVKGVVRYNVFCPKAFAGIAGQRMPLPATVLDRSIQIRLRRRMADEPVAPFKHYLVAGETAPLRERLEAFRDRHGSALLGLIPELPPSLSDRAQEAWEPLLNIAELAGGDWPDRARRAATALTEAVEEEADPGIQFLADCRAVFDSFGVPRLRTATLSATLAGLEEPQYEGQLTLGELARLLRRFDIKPKVLRFGKTTARGYQRDSFEEAWARYLPQRP